MIRICLQNRIWVIGFRVVSRFIQMVISQNDLQLLGRLKKYVMLRQHLAISARTTLPNSIRFDDVIKDEFTASR